MTKCSDQALEDLLILDEDSQPGSLRLQEVTKHVESCTACQQRLTELAADGEQWRELSTCLAPEELSSDFWAASRRAGESRTRTTSWTQSMAQSLLSPAKHPEMLGRIGRYDVERLIGSGGMGIVLKAHDTELNRPVAIKILAPYLAENTAARQRFAREARAAAAVVDDHVVPIYNVETDGGEIPFLVMQYVAGGSLQQRIDRQGPLEVAEVLRIGLHTAKGLAAAHAQGLIHRDVKPSNILLDESVERALLTDFGLARASNDIDVTRTGFQPGTPQYMSPEQVRGEAIDARSDLFGLGCVMYALCTGHPPFQSDTGYAVLRLITDSQPQPVRDVNPDIPDWLEMIVMKLLQKSPHQRYDSAHQLVQTLQTCLSHVQNPDSNPLPDRLRPRPQARGAGRRWSKWLMSAVLACGVVVCGLLAAVEWNKGTLTITSTRPGIPIRILKGGKPYTRLVVEQTKKSVRVAAGEYLVEIDGDFDGLFVEGDVVVLKRGEEQLVRIVHETEPPTAKNASAGTKPNVSADAVLTDGVDHQVIVRGTTEDVSRVRGNLGRRDLSYHVEQFNRLCGEHSVGRNQPPLTNDEVRTSLRWLLTTDEDFRQSPAAEILQGVLDSGHLPDGWSLCGEVVELDDAQQEPLASVWRIRLADVEEGVKTVHIIRQHYLQPRGDFDRDSAGTGPEDVADPDGMPLQAAIRAFNTSSRRTIDGQRQPPLTMSEVLAAIRGWQSRRDDAPVVNRDFDAFQRIAETGMLPADTKFEVLHSFAPGDGRVYFIYSVRILTPQSDKPGWTYAYTIRERYLSSRPRTDSEDWLRYVLPNVDASDAPDGSEALQGKWLHNSVSGSTETMSIFHGDEGRLMLKFLDASGQTQQGHLHLSLENGGTRGRFTVARRAMNRTVREWSGFFELKDELLRWHFNALRDFEFGDEPVPDVWESILRQPARPMLGEAHYRKCPADTRRVTFRSHLDGTVEDDPVVEPGEQIAAVPDRSDPLVSYDEVLMQLPTVTPYEGDDQLYYLRGWAVGRMGDSNGQIAAHSTTSEARRFTAWNAGWMVGFQMASKNRPFAVDTEPTDAVKELEE